MRSVVRTFLQGLGLILVSGGIMEIIEMIIVMVYVRCGVFGISVVIYFCSGIVSTS